MPNFPKNKYFLPPDTHTHFEIVLPPYCQRNILQKTNLIHREEISFLAKLFKEENYNHGVLVAFRSALSETVCQMMKRKFRLGPTLPRYTATYDPDTMLPFMDNSPNHEHLRLESSTKKISILLFLLMPQVYPKIGLC